MSDGALLVFGRSGQLAQELARFDGRSGRRVVCVGREECDLAAGDDPARVIDAQRPAAVINAAAYTAVDRAESEPEATLALNRDAPAAIARACAEAGVPLIHVSTDYVFDGSKGAPYTEEDVRSPLGVYGSSKAAGEDVVRASAARGAVVRVAWLWSVYGSNFPKTMLRLARERDEVGVVSDQRGRPTSAAMAAGALTRLSERLIASLPGETMGLFHLSNRGEATWAEFAETLFALSGARGGPSARVNAISTAEYPTAARRPADSRLDPSKLETLLETSFPDWRDSLKAAMDDLIPIEEARRA